MIYFLLDKDNENKFLKQAKYVNNNVHIEKTWLIANSSVSFAEK